MDNISLSNETRTNGRLGCATEHILTNSQTEMHHDIANVAGRLSISSASAPAEGQSQVFNPTPGGKFDPSSPAAFDARLWTPDPVSVPTRSLGVAFKGLSVFAYGTAAQLRKTTGSVVSGAMSYLSKGFGKGRNAARSGAPWLRVLYSPLVAIGRIIGLACSSGIVHKLSSDVLYNAELDTHLAHLTVGETLIFASCARSIRHIPQGITRLQFNTMRRDVMMAIFGLNRTINTRVGDDIIRGVSGGERKRVSIAEASLTGAKFQCWDNSTRGLDSANAINFCNNLRLQADLLDVTSVVTLYQAPQATYDVLTIYAERPAVEKQNRYAFYHQSAQAIASYLADLPYKVVNMFIFNIVIYFMANLRREVGAPFFFCLTTLLTSLVQSAMFRTLACLTGTPDQAMIPSAVLSLGLMIYTGFTTPLEYMPGWSRWMAYINPLAYGFEALMANEFHNRDFPCVSIVPSGQGYANLPPVSQTCSVVGSEAGLAFVNGDNYIGKSLITGTHIHGETWAFFLLLWSSFSLLTCLLLSLQSLPKHVGRLLFHRRSAPPKLEKLLAQDTENQVQRYPVEDRKMEPSNQPNNIGVSGAGKTTLLDVLATRVTTGIVTGDTMVNGNPTTSSFQHKVGYVQQQDLHLSTMTVREALQFSAILRQSTAIPKLEKLKYVEHVIDILGMQEYSDAVIGVPGEGLNVEQRKRLTIGVELAARPQLLIFFDEPTSGLDSQTSWAISELIKKLASNGQAVLCTIHQPSAVLFDRFDRLLLIAHGGRTVYFGDLGKGASTLINYFEKHNAPKCPAGGNPAEWMSEVIQSPPGGPEGKDWHQIWLDSPEYQTVQAELRRLRSLSTIEVTTIKDDPQNQEFVSTFWTQFSEVLQRTWKHLWRSPIYIWPKTILIILTSLYLGFSFDANNSIQGLQNQSNIIVELIWHSLMAAIMYFCWYYPEENSVGVPPGDLPKFWSFMHRVSPATYLVGGLISSAVANSDVKCAAREILHMAPVGNLICKEFLTPYIEAAGGAVLNPASRDICEYCPLASTNEFLNRFQISYDTRWRDFGLLWVYILVNIVAGLGFYWIFKFPKRGGSRRA
ncbi:ABC transporter [Trichophyton tonsurans CBS 112818]|uniref:ABC transporter n=1 Tax=Trichophyton tonsurans (strain CBS 112818) TaxID=647933 RepID=F2RU98_TRIT1|nr:ABC transporter [Trichophyton tonsurans CBS 112818]